MKPNIGLSDKQREGVVNILNALLADEFVLYTKTRNYHWNVVGPKFKGLHIFFEEQYEELSDRVDEVAEVARAFGGWALGTLAEFSQQTRLTEHPGRYPKAHDMIPNLLADHEAIIHHLREGIKTCGDQYQVVEVADFLTELMQQHQKTAWMLRTCLEGE